MKKLLKFLSICAVVIITAVSAWAQPYYVATTGNDGTGDGSAGNPWLTIQHAINQCVGGETINVAAGTYPGAITMPASIPITLVGAGMTQTFLTSGMVLSDNVDGITLQQFALSGAGGSGRVIHGGHYNKDFTMDHILIDGEGSLFPARNAIAGGRTIGDVTITNCEFKNVGGWSVFDCATSGWETVMGTVTFAHNYIHDCDGAVAFRGDNTDRIDLVTVHDNVWENINDNWNPHPTVQNAWACFEAHGVEVLEFYDNTMTNVNMNQWGEGQGLQTWRVGDIDIYNNLFEDSWQGIWLPGLGTEPVPTGSIYDNCFNNITDYAVFTSHGGGGFNPPGDLDAENNWWDDTSGPSGVGPGTGGKVSADVDYTPWSSSCFVTTIFTTIETPTEVSCGVYDIDVTVQHFNNVGAISLDLSFDPLLLGSPVVTNLTPGLTANFPNAGQLRVAFWGSPITLADDAVLFTLHFDLLPAPSGGTSNLTWSTVPGECEYSGPNGSPVYTSTFNDLAWTIPVRPVVNLNTTLEYCKIQDAHDDVLTLTSHTISVMDGIYTEDVTITKGITITGQSETGVIVQAAASLTSSANTFTINAAGLNVTLEKMTIRHGDYGVRSSAGNINVKNCTFYHNGWDGTGVPVTPTQSAMATFFSTYATNGGAIRIENSAASEIANCTVYENDRGIRFQDGANGLIHDNEIYGNIETGIYLAASTYTGATGCSNTQVYDNQSYDNMEHGLLSIGGIGNSFTNNTNVTGNWNCGMMLWHAADITVEDNTFTGNNIYGFNGVGSSADAKAAIYFDGDINNAAATFVGNIIGNTLTNNLSGSSALPIAILVDDPSPAQGINITGNTFTGHDIDLNVKDQPTTVVANNNNLSGSVYGVLNEVPTGIVDATLNWWGHASGPSAVAYGTGVPVSDYVDYCPWLGGTYPGGAIVANVYNITALTYHCTIQDAIDNASNGDVISVASGTYNETVAIDVGVTIQGDAAGSAGCDGIPHTLTTFITGGITIAAGVDGLTLENLHLTGVGASNSIIRMLGDVHNYTMDNCVLDGGLVSGRHGFSGGRLEDDATISNCEFKDVLGWALFESRSGSGGGGSPLGTINFTGNCIHHCNGTVVFRGDGSSEPLNTTYTSVVNISGNTWQTIGGNGAATGDQWAAFEVNRAIEVNVSQNVIDDVIVGAGGQGQAAQLWNIDDLTVENNYFTNCEEGIWVASVNGYAGLTTAGNLNNNYILNVGTVGGAFVPTGIALLNVTANNTLNATCNWWGSFCGNIIAALITGPVNFTPWLIGGNDGTGFGFQPTDPCTGVFPELTSVSLQASKLAAGPPWDYLVSGDLSGGYSMCITPDISSFYLDINTLTSSPGLLVDFLNPFVLDQTGLPATWLPYWASKGVDGGGYGDWRDQMWLIINGNAPFFYIKYTSGSDYILVDGLQYWAAQQPTPTPGAEPILILPGDYPNHIYTYTGNITDVDGCVSLPINVTMDFHTCDLSGILAYNNSAQTGLNNMTVTLNTTPPVSANTGTDGSYTLSNVQSGTHTITFNDNGLTAGGINATDAAQANYWGTSSWSIEKVRFFAGDVNNDNYVLALDAQQILAYFVNAGNVPYNFTPIWKFWLAGDMISGNPYAGPANPSVTVLSTPVTQGLYGLCTGDFNQSFIPGLTKSASESLLLKEGKNIFAEVGTELELPIVAGMDMDIGAVSLILNFPADKVEISDVFLTSDPSSSLMYNISGDELRIGWNSMIPAYLDKGESLITLYMKVTNESGEEGISLSLVADPLNELANGDFFVINDAVLIADVIHTSALGIANNMVDKLALANHPNPFRGTTNFVYSLPIDGKVILEIYDLVGNKVMTAVDEAQTAGEYTVELEANRLQPGVYTATLRLSNEDSKLVRTIKILSR